MQIKRHLIEKWDKFVNIQRQAYNCQTSAGYLLQHINPTSLLFFTIFIAVALDIKMELVFIDGRRKNKFFIQWRSKIIVKPAIGLQQNRKRSNFYTFSFER